MWVLEKVTHLIKMSKIPEEKLPLTTISHKQNFHHKHNIVFKKQLIQFKMHKLHHIFSSFPD